MKYQMARTVVTIVVAIVFGVAPVTSAAAQGRGRHLDLDTPLSKCLIAF